MDILAAYLFKVSLTLMVLFLFYHWVLSRLTFFRWNRLLLSGSFVLAYLLPLINVDAWLASRHETLQVLPAIPAFFGNVSSSAGPSYLSSVFTGIVCTGTLVMLIRFVINFASLQKIRRSSLHWKEFEGAQLFTTADQISPFSFRQSIFLNTRMFSPDELEKIIQHECVHVREKHTFDLLIGELLITLNWFNPFAWLLRKAMRQNLEYIADRQVLAHGSDPQQYQFLLLKVSGATQGPIVNNFYLPDLKKRIKMMNKLATASAHLVKLALIIPIMGAVIIACRNDNSYLEKQKQENLIGVRSEGVTIKVDTLSLEEVADQNAPVVIVDGVLKSGDVVKSLDPGEISSITVWKDKKALEKFGDKGKNGVIDITTKK